MNACKDCRQRAGVYDGRCARCRDRALALRPPPIDPEDEWTEEELESLIAAQMQNLPPWWEQDMEREARKDGRIAHNIGWLIYRGRV